VAALFATHLWSQPFIAFVFAASIVAMTFNGLLQRRPPWFYAWAGLALTLLAFCGYFAFSMAERGLSFIGSGSLDVLSAFGLAGAAVYFPLGLFVLLSCILAANRRDWLDASLMLAPSAPVVVWLASLHQGATPGDVADPALTRFDAPLALVFLALAPAVAAFVRVPLRAAKLAIMVATASLLLVASSVGAAGETSLLGLLAQGGALFGLLLAPAAVELASGGAGTARAFGRLSGWRASRF